MHHVVFLQVLNAESDTKRLWGSVWLQNIHDALWINRYSNSELTASSYYSIFESLWIQCKIKEQKKVQRVWQIAWPNLVVVTIIF
jgi:hypothetical protein